MSNMNSTLNSMKGKSPRPLWPWIVGAAVAVGGAQYIRKSKINVKHTAGTPLTKPQTKVDVKKVE